MTKDNTDFNPDRQRALEEATKRIQNRMKKIPKHKGGRLKNGQ